MGHSGVEMTLQMSAALDYAAAGDEKEMRSHYLWLVKQMMANMGGPEELTTAALVATVVAWMPDHTRVLVGREPADGDGAAVLQLIRGQDDAASGT